jgi:hypothetical protein
MLRGATRLAQTRTLDALSPRPRPALSGRGRGDHLFAMIRPMNELDEKVEIVLRMTDKASREIWPKRALSEADVRETASWLRRWYPGTGYIVERVVTRIVGEGIKHVNRIQLVG